MSTTQNSSNRINSVVVAANVPAVPAATAFASQSAFTDGRQFQITDTRRVQIVKNGQTAPADNARIHPQLVTNLMHDGEPAVIWLSSYRDDKQKLNVNNQVVRKDGTADAVIFRIIREAVASTDPSQSTDLAVLNRILAEIGNRPLVVRRKHYTGINSYGQTSPMSVACFDFA